MFEDQFDVIVILLPLSSALPGLKSGLRLHYWLM